MVFRKCEGSGLGTSGSGTGKGFSQWLGGTGGFLLLASQAVFSLSTFDQSRSERVESMCGHFRCPGTQLDGLLLFWLRHHDRFCS